ncbi:MAG TPA: hypothetical protein VFM21_06005, partial [Terriglobia bacterium]|nr:hypothetical protein [Terriglobia bacterium]
MDATQVEHELQTAVEGAAGTDVWIKPPASRSAKAAKVQAGTVQVLTTRQAFDRVLAAIKESSSRQNLQADANFRKSSNNEREAEVLVTIGKRLIARWDVREV